MRWKAGAESPYTDDRARDKSLGGELCEPIFCDALNVRLELFIRDVDPFATECTWFREFKDGSVGVRRDAGTKCLKMNEGSRHG